LDFFLTLAPLRIGLEVWDVHLSRLKLLIVYGAPSGVITSGAKPRRGFRWRPDI